MSNGDAMKTTNEKMHPRDAFEALYAGKLDSTDYELGLRFFKEGWQAALTAPQPQNHSEPAANPLGDVEQPEAVEPVAFRYRIFYRADEYENSPEHWGDWCYSQIELQFDPMWKFEQEPLYALSPTATQALRMAADVAYGFLSTRGDLIAADVVKQAILAVTPVSQGDSPSAFESDQRKLGFAEGVKAAGTAIETAVKRQDNVSLLEVQNILAALTQPTETDQFKDGFAEGWKQHQKLMDAIRNADGSTPPTDTVTMTRKELEEFGMRCARCANTDEEVYLHSEATLRAIVAQRMPKESK